MLESEYGGDDGSRGGTQKEEEFFLIGTIITSQQHTHNIIYISYYNIGPYMVKFHHKFIFLHHDLCHHIFIVLYSEPYTSHHTSNLLYGYCLSEYITCIQTHIYHVIIHSSFLYCRSPRETKHSLFPSTCLINNGLWLTVNC